MREGPDSDELIRKLLAGIAELMGSGQKKGTPTPYDRRRNVRGLGRIFKRPGSPYWYIGYSVGGKERKESSRSTKKDDAKMLLKRRLEEFSHFRPGAWFTPTVGTILENYLADLGLRGTRTMRRTRQIAKYFDGMLGSKKALDVSPGTIRELQSALLSGGRSQPTVNRYIQVLQSALYLAEENGIIPKVPKFPRRLKESEPRKGFLSHSAYLAIRAELPCWAQDIFDFAYFTGWRRGEIFGLSWWNVDMEAGVIRLEGGQTKNKRSRQRPIGDIAEIVERRIDARVASCQYVFHKNGRQLESAKWHRAWDPARKKAGHPKTLLHDCRRTAYRNMIRAGVPQKVAAEMVGWTSMTMPWRYNVTSFRDHEDAVERYSEYLKSQAVGAERKVLSFRKEKP